MCGHDQATPQGRLDRQHEKLTFHLLCDGCGRDLGIVHKMDYFPRPIRNEQIVLPVQHPPIQFGEAA